MHELTVKNLTIFAIRQVEWIKARKLIEYKVNYYKVSVKKEHGRLTVTIKYKGRPFSFNNAINTRLSRGYFGGAGSDTFRQYRNRLSYKYQDGWNIYKIKLNSDSNFKLTHIYPLDDEHFFKSPCNSMTGVITESELEIISEIYSELQCNIYDHRETVNTKYFSLSNEDMTITSEEGDVIAVISALHNDEQEEWITDVDCMLNRRYGNRNDHT